jgi:hypothetical protein
MSQSFEARLRLLQVRLVRYIERLRGYPSEKTRFMEKMGYPLNLESPKSFSEKIVWKKLNDRNPLLPITADKLRVRKFLVQELGEEEAARILIPLLWSGRDPDEIPFETLPASYIVKATQGSGWNILVRNGDKSPYEVREAIRKWLVRPYGVRKLEWAYESIRPQVLIETLLLDEAGEVPKDFKFFMIHGTCRMILVDIDRFGEHAKTLYDSEWNLLPVRRGVKQGGEVERPANLEKMLRLAEQLSAKFDFVRVDLYSLGHRVYFGELTHYPASGMEPFEPRTFDFQLGSYWNIDAGYWKKGSFR